MKTLYVSLPGANEQHELEIDRGTTAGDVIAHLNLEGYELIKPGSETNERFNENEDVYSAIKDEQILKAGTPAPFG